MLEVREPQQQFVLERLKVRLRRDIVVDSVEDLRRDVFGTMSSWETYSYNFQDQVVSHTVSRNSTASLTTVRSSERPKR